MFKLTKKLRQMSKTQSGYR